MFVLIQGPLNYFNLFFCWEVGGGGGLTSDSIFSCGAEEALYNFENIGRS